LAGKVQMIYLDPPYGIKFASNFQPQVGQRDVKDKEQDLTREPEMVKAYRDTWHLGVHSYLSYLRDRLITARELLTDTGSIFVQIGDENLHRVRLLLEEIFGAQNLLAVARNSVVFSRFQSFSIPLHLSPADAVPPRSDQAGVSKSQAKSQPTRLPEAWTRMDPQIQVLFFRGSLAMKKFFIPAHRAAA